MSSAEIAALILEQNDAHPARCFLAVQAIAVASALEREALCLAVHDALHQTVTRQYELAVSV